jgi:hypothetical protein
VRNHEGRPPAFHRDQLDEAGRCAAVAADAGRLLAEHDQIGKHSFLQEAVPDGFADHVVPGDVRCAVARLRCRCARACSSRSDRNAVASSSAAPAE